MTQSSHPNPPLVPWQRLPRRTLAIALSVLPLMALANVGVLVWSLDGINLADRIAVPGFLVLAVVTTFLPMVANSLRLALWGRFLGVGLGFRGGLKVVTGTIVANSITPSAAGGVPLKLLFLMGEGVSSRKAATLISLQAAEDAVVLGVLVALCVGFSGFQLMDFIAGQPGLIARIEGNLALFGWIALGVACVLAGVIFAIVSGAAGAGLQAKAAQIGARMRSFAAHMLHDWLRVLRRGKGVALANLVLALVQWLSRFSLAGIVLAGFGQAWHPALYWLLQYVVQSISSVVPTPGGAGGAEAAFLLMFAPFVASGVLVPAMSAWRLIFFYLPLTGAAVLFFLLHRAGGRAAARRHARSARDSAIAGQTQPAE